MKISIQSFLKSVFLDSIGRCNLDNNNNLFFATPEIKSEFTKKLTSLDRNWNKRMKEMETKTDDLKKKTEGNFFY